MVTIATCTLLCWLSWLSGANADRCYVKYVDYGNSELVTMTALQEIQPKHCALPEQAIHCTLISACCPADGWSIEVCQFGSCDLKYYNFVRR